MNLLVDTNIFLEVLLEQSRADETRDFLSQVSNHDFFISDFLLHSIGLILLRRNKADAFRKFLADMILGAGTKVAFLKADEIARVIDLTATFSLDFDDAYQYATAEKYDLTLVSFDRDFDKTTRGRTEPSAIPKVNEHGED
jgi:predicted nucleic acid-binding protein